MIIGDEYVYLRAVAGGLPPHLDGQLIALPPAAFTRLRRSLERPRALQAPRRGAITRLAQDGSEMLGVRWKLIDLA